MGEYRVTIHEPHNLHHTVLMGDGCEVWPFTTILEGTALGKNVTVGTGVFIGRRCLIGQGTRIHPNAALPDGTIIGEHVFVGASVTLTDVAYPNLRDKSTEVHRPPIIEDEVVLGSNCVILPGVTVHRGAVVGAGSVVTHDVKAHTVVVGNPARPTKARLHMTCNEAGEVVG